MNNTADEDSEESGGEDEDEEEESDGVSDLPTPTPTAPPKDIISPTKRNTVIREARKAPLPSMTNTKPVKQKTRFPMIIKPDCSS